MQLSDSAVIGVVGAGQMGAGIAQVCALAGYAVLLVDSAAERAQAGKAGIARQLARLCDKGKLDPALRDAALGRIELSSAELAYPRADLVIEAASGPEALRVADDYEGPIHLLVSDMVMPKMSGRELAIRFAEWRPSMKALFISGYTDNGISSQDVVDSGVSFLQKPFTPSQLAGKVREVLDK